VTLTTGTRLCTYEIGEAIGTGGMGAVYRAHDTKLGREVALKVLLPEVADNPERLARFRREAQILASLNHPNIAHIYGLEESEGVVALVLELVEGPTLADRISKGAIRLDEALLIAKQIAEALEAAHEHGIVHRDLKPANIKARPDGTVKVLDFGLAKALEPISGVRSNLADSPTITSPAMTQMGVLLGTAAYMAPEQARGRVVDKRADVWAFGTVLFEMVSGRPPFPGDDISQVLARVIDRDPDWQALPGETPAALRRLLTRCLKKDPRDRLHDIGDARIEILELVSGATELATPAISRARPPWRRAILMTTINLVTATVTGTIVWFAARQTVAPPQISRFAITLPSSAPLSLNGVSRDVTLTPDGSRLVYVGANDSTLFVRPLDQLQGIPLVRSTSIRHPFVSADGQWVGFFDGLLLKKVALTGGPAVLVTRLDFPGRGATWAPDGTIIFATASGTTVTGLQRVSADGGTPVVLTRPDRAHGEASHWWPELLPGGQAVLYTVTATTGGLDAASIAVLDLRSGRQTILLRGGSHAQYAPSGHLVYAAAGTLRAVGFDARSMSLAGTPVPVVPQVLTTTAGAVEAELARDGTLVYVAGDVRSGGRTLVWVDPQGGETALAAPPRSYVAPRLSPDHTRVAVMAGDVGGADIWVSDLARPGLARVTTEGTNLSAVWMDNRRVVISSDREGAPNLFSQAADGTGDVERLTESPNPQNPSAVSSDGTQLVFTETSTTTGDDVMLLALDGQHQVHPLVQTPFDERNGIVSPDRQWLAYEANDTGRFEIYIRPFPDTTRGRWPASTSGGTQPLWARNGRELFYLAPDGALMHVTVPKGSAWNASAPTKVLEGRYVVRTGSSTQRTYDVADDGRFLMLKAPGSDPTDTPPQLIVVQHFDEELKRLMPTTKE
jgi:serine/threonine-protein kinase